MVDASYEARIDALANRFFGALEARDVDAATAVYHPDIRVWHSRDEADTDIEQNREILRLFMGRVSDFRYDVIRRHVFNGGWVQEHVVHMTSLDGAKTRLPVCFIAHVDDDGRVTRIAEYLDSARSLLRDVVQHDAPAPAAG